MEVKMEVMAIQARVEELLGLILGRTITNGTLVQRASEPVWDSIKHIELFFALEDAFGVRFGEDELAGLNSIDAIVASVERHLAA